MRAIVPTLPTSGVLCGFNYTAAVSDVASTGGGDVGMYPNPARNNITIEVTTAVSCVINVALTDISGRVVLQTSIPANRPTQLSLGYPPGMYMLTATWQSGRVCRKVLVE